MIFAREGAEGFLDLVVRRLGCHPKHTVIVFEFNGHFGRAWKPLGRSLSLWPGERSSFLSDNHAESFGGWHGRVGLDHGLAKALHAGAGRTACPRFPHSPRRAAGAT